MFDRDYSVLRVKVLLRWPGVVGGWWPGII